MAADVVQGVSGLPVEVVGVGRGDAAELDLPCRCSIPPRRD